MMCSMYMILRPGLVYGRNSPIWVVPFASFAKAHREKASSVDFYTKQHVKAPLIHIDNIGTGVAPGASKICFVGGLIPFSISLLRMKAWQRCLGRR